MRSDIAARSVAACFAVLLACALTPGAGLAQDPSPGVFSTLQPDLVPDIGIELEPATMRSRVVTVDTQQLTAARLGQETLRLNLFDDAIVDVRIDQVRPTRSGYFISGRPEGFEWGDVRLVVNGPVVVGTVVTPDGRFTIRSDGSGRHVIRQVDPSMDPLDFEEEPQLPPAPQLPREPNPSGDSPPFGAVPVPLNQWSDVPTEDGSEVRILVVYTPALMTSQGGVAGTEALIDLLVQSANQAFEDSGIDTRLTLAHTALTNYTGNTVGGDLTRLRVSDDGFMDEVHALRNSHAADLVHLLTGTGLGSNLVLGARGVAVLFTAETLRMEDSAAFSVTSNDSELVFTHEVGHNLGLHHDRYVLKSPSAIYPYAYGYVNKKAFEPGAPDSARWRTVMSYDNRCAGAGFSCEWLLRFSNPDQTHEGDMLGVPASDTSTGYDGPADARLAVSRSARWIASFRSEACTEFAVSPRDLVISVHGATVLVDVGAAPGCLWEVSSQADFATVESEELSAGSGVVQLAVEANGSGQERTGTLTVAGKTLSVRQLGTDAGVCGRTQSVFLAITRAAGFTDPADCDDVTAADLAGITSLDLGSTNIDSLQDDDFEGLSGLTSLRLNNNRLTDLPEGIFSDLSNLTLLYLRDNRLSGLSAGALSGLAALETLDLSGNPLRGLPEAAFSANTRLQGLELENNGLGALPDGIFSGLTALKRLNLRRNALSSLPVGIFSDLTALQTLLMDGNRLNSLPDGVFSGLTALQSLGFNENSLASLPADIFSGLTALQSLDLSTNNLSTLPGAVLSGLSSLRSINLAYNQLRSLPAEVFSGLAGLSHIGLGRNPLRSLPAGLFTGLSKLRILHLHQTQLNDLPMNSLAGLTALENLRLDGNFLTDLPAGVFSGLPSLQSLDLRENGLTGLPDGVFSGLAAPRQLILSGNPVDPLPLQVSLRNVGDSQFKAVAPAGAPVALGLAISVSEVGEIEGGASTLTIPAGALESEVLEVTRKAGTTEAVEVDIGSLPGLPSSHNGYALRKDQSLPLRLLASNLATDATLIGLSLSDGVLDPAFGADDTSYTAYVPHSVSSISVTAETSNSNATVEYLDADDAALEDADANAQGHQVGLSVGGNTIKVRITAEDQTTIETYSIAITRDGAANVCGRSEGVRDEIVRFAGVDGCLDVTPAQLAEIFEFRLNSAQYASVKSGDFAGMTRLRAIWMSALRTNSLPADIFSGLTALEEISIFGTPLSSLPANVFSGLSALEYIYLGFNELRSLPPGVFSGLTALEKLYLSDNRLGSLPDKVFSGLNALREVNLGGNRLSNLPEDVFLGLDALESIELGANQLAYLPAGVFSGLGSLQRIGMANNRFRSLPADTFSGLVQLERIYAVGNRFSSLPGEIFAGLTALQDIHLKRNRLSSLPDGIFVGLGTLRSLDLSENTVDPLPLPVSLEKIQDGSFKSVAPTGAPFTLEFTASVSSGGEFADGGAVTVPAGALESAPVGVTRVAGSVDAVTADIGTLPALPEEHRGYFLQKDTSLPISVLPQSNVPPPAQVVGVAVTVGQEQLDVSWTAVSDATGYKVQWKSGEEDYDAARQALIPAGDITSHTISGLTAGTEYTVRVIATKQDARDGPPSDEVMGTPQAVSLEQVTGLEVVAGTNRLELSWTEVANAGGYKVQWKSGEEDFDETRQTLISAGNITSHTITGLTADTEYTVRVIATREGTDDGPPSDEVTGTPQAVSPLLVTGLEIEPGVEQLAVTWVGVSEADGYKVQWKSGAEIYDESRQALIATGDTTSHTITGLTAGAEYTVRVIATRQDADDGPPSDEVTGIPRAAAVLSDLSLSDGTLDPVFASDTTDYTATVAHTVSSATVTPTTSNANATVAFLDGNDAALPDADTAVAGHQVNLAVGRNTIRIRVTSAGSTATRTYTLTVTRDGAENVCLRTPQVRDAILEAQPSVSHCSDFTSIELERIQFLDLDQTGITSLRSGDFGGLTSLRNLSLIGNQLSGLPADIFSELGALKYLYLGGNQLGSLPEAVFSGLTSLEDLTLYSNNLSSLPANIFSGLAALEAINLNYNRLSVLPADVFSGLAALERLVLKGNGLTALPSGVFSGLAALERLDLGENELSALPADIFSGLAALENLSVYRNRLSSLPAGIFSGLTSLSDLALQQNTVDPLPVSVSLEKVGTTQFKAVAPTGAPFALAVPVTITGGTIAGSASTVTIPAGALESAAVGVSRALGSNAAVTVDIGTLPALPGAHDGYVLERDTALPLTVLPYRQSSDTSLRSLSLSHGTLAPVFAADTTSYTASVPHAVESITVTATPNDSGATLRYVDGDDQALADADANTAGHQVSLSPGNNVIRVAVTSEDGSLIRRYTIVMTREASICGRTGAVVAAIVQAVSGVDSCGYVTSAQLAGITLLDLSGQSIASLQSGDFAGLSALQTLHLNDNQLTALPADIFSLLTTLETLSLADNRLESLPVAVFSRLTALRFLYLNANRLTSLPNGTLAGLSRLEVLRLHNNRIGSLRANAFSGLSSLEELLLNDNGLTGLPAAVFSGLSSLDDLRLNGNRLTSLPAGLFSGLSALQTLQLHGNRLSTLPDGLFAGLTSLGALTLGGNTVNPMPLTVSLEKAGSDQFKAVAPTGAPFALALPLSVSSGGEIDGGASSITIPAGAVESTSLSVTRTSQAGPAVTVDFGTLPSLPSAHSGYVFAKDTALPLTVLPSLGSSETRLSDLSLSDGTLDPVFNPDTSSYTASVPHAVASITVTPTTSNQNATVAFSDGSDAALADADANTDGHQVSLSSGANVIKVVVTAENRTSVRTYTLVMTREASICNRTAKVVDAIVQAVSGVDSCGYVTSAHLAGITALDLRNQSIASLQSGDFAGLSALKTLYLFGNQLTALPADVFAGLAALDTLDLRQNQLASLPASVFSGLAALRQLNLDRNRLSGLPGGVFSGLSRLEALFLWNNRISSLPAHVFSGLSSLTGLYLSSNSLTGLPANVFSGLSSLQQLHINVNSLTSLPTGVFSGLSSLQTLYLNHNGLTSLRADTFSGLSSLQTLWLQSNAFTSLPAGLLSGRSALQQLNLRGNRLTALPNGFFAGLSNLNSVDLQENATNPMLIPVSLEKVGADQFKAVAPTGAPTAFALSLSVSSGGAIAGGATSITIPAGAVESGSLGVTRTAEAGPAITVDIGALPALPSTHMGYALQKDATLPRAILPAVRAATPAQVTGVGVTPGAEQLQLSWTAVSDAGGYKVEWKSGTEDYAEARQAAISSGTTTSYTIAGLTAGTEYTVRVIATKEHADDGSPSDEVTGTPRAATPGQVTGLEVTAGTNQLEVSWTAVSDAGGYKVQWKSGSEDYDAARQAVISSGATTSYTIAGLTAGTEYTVRVIATKEHADDGSPSDEATGTPLAVAPAQVAGLEVEAGTNRLEVSWTAVSDAGGYKVQWKSGTEDYAEARQAAISSGTTTSYTIAGLTAGTEYTVRVIATKEHADDGSPSDEVTGTPRAATPGQVTGLEVTAGTNQLEVSWTAVSDAGGYKVQWKSGSEDYDEARQSVITSGATTSHTITGLTAGTEYTVRVIATKQHADDGTPSDEATGTPRAAAVLSSITLSNGTLDPVFASDTTSYTASVARGWSSITVTVTTNPASAEVEFRDENDSALPDRNADRDGHQVRLRAGENVIKVVVTAEDGGSVRAYTLVVTREPSICNRTEEVVDAIVAFLSGIDACRYVSKAHLASISILNMNGDGITSLQPGDFEGLSGVQLLSLYDNELTTLPAGVFAGLSGLQTLHLYDNELTTVSSGAFTGLSALRSLHLGENKLTSLPANVFSGLSSLEVILLGENEFTSIPANLFSGLSALTSVWIQSNKLTSLPSGVFSGLSSLKSILLNHNALTSLPANVISGLSALETIWLSGNSLSSLPAGVFSGLSSLEDLMLDGNRLTSLPANVFSGLSNLKRLHFGQNQLTALPAGLFAGLTKLGSLGMHGNSVNPLPLSVSLEKVGSNQFKAVAPIGAPFALVLPVSSAGGTIDGSTTTVTIPAGSVESAAVGVSRAEGDTEAVTVDIGTLPALPSSHGGYALTKDSTLPRTILPATGAAPPVQVSGVVVAPTPADPDVNGDGALNSSDAMLMWNAFDYEDLVGDGETGGTAESRQRLLGGYSGGIDPSDEDLQAVLRRANAWRSAGIHGGGDVNADGMIDGLDARAMYNAYAYESLLGDGEEGGAVRFRTQLLGPLAGMADPADEVLEAMLRRANELREAYGQ